MPVVILQGICFVKIVSKLAFVEVKIMLRKGARSAQTPNKQRPITLAMLYIRKSKDPLKFLFVPKLCGPGERRPALYKQEGLEDSQCCLLQLGAHMIEGWCKRPSRLRTMTRVGFVAMRRVATFRLASSALALMGRIATVGCRGI
jgi:hypothetical protein